MVFLQYLMVFCQVDVQCRLHLKHTGTDLKGNVREASVVPYWTAGQQTDRLILHKGHDS